MQESGFRPLSVVRRPPVKLIFSEPIKQIDAKFGGKVPFRHISKKIFLFFKILNFLFFMDSFRFR